MKHSKLFAASLLAILFSFASAYAEDVYKTSYVSLGRQSAVLYQPAVPSAKSGIGVVVMHSGQDYLGHIANAALSGRGYTVIASIPAQGQMMDAKLLSIKACVDYLRRMPGVGKVILMGHSGGATTMTAYQLIAEQGSGILKDKLFSDYTADLSNLPKVDGMLLLDANYGNATMSLMSLDPNIKSAGTGMNIEMKLNLADAEAGYNPNGSSNYTEEFVKTYTRAQRDRLNELMSEAFSRLSAIREGRGSYADDEPFVIAGASQIRPYNKLFPQDLRLLSHTKRAWPLIHGDGTVTTEIVRSVRAPMRPDAKSNGLGAAMTTTVKGFLSSCALTVGEDFHIGEDGIEGIVWSSNINNPIGNAGGITVPVLMMGMTGSWEYLAAELIYDHCPSVDKSLAFVEGASHDFTTDSDAERYNRKSYGDTAKALFDYIDEWLGANGRFL